MDCLSLRVGIDHRIPFCQLPHCLCETLQLLTPIALFSFLKTALKSEERTQITQIIFAALFIAGVFEASVGIAQYFKQAPLGLRLLGETNQVSTFDIQSGSRWLFDSLTNRKAATTVIRAAGTLPHANVFGGFLVISILSSYALFMLIEKRKWVVAITLPFQIFALCISYSRAALFAWIISTIIWTALIIWKKGLKNRTVKATAILVALSTAICASLLLQQFSNRGGVVNYNSLAKGSDDVRTFHQHTALQIMKDRPLLGLGYNQFSERAQKYFPVNTSAYVSRTGPHNIFLFLACETGLISLFAFMSFIALLLWTAIRTQITVESATLLSLLIGLLFIGLCDFYLILFQQGKLMFFLTAGLLAMNVRRDSEIKIAIDSPMC